MTRTVLADERRRRLGGQVMYHLPSKLPIELIFFAINLLTNLFLYVIIASEREDRSIIGKGV